MTKNKTLTIIALLLIVLGGIIFAGAMTAVKWDFNKLSTEKFENHISEITESFDSIYVNVDTADIVILESQNDKVVVDCFENVKTPHSVSVENNTLFIKFNDQRKWYERIEVNFYSTKITISVPSGVYNSLKIIASTGSVETSKEHTYKNIDISVSTGSIKCLSSATENTKLEASTGNVVAENISAKNLDIITTTGKITAKNILVSEDFKARVSTGETKVREVKCKNFISNGSTGDIDLIKVLATEKIEITRGTGDIEFEKCDANELNLKTSTGDVEGTLLSSKVFSCKSSTGEVDVPKTTSGGLCNVNTSTGDIELSIKPE